MDPLSITASSIAIAHLIHISLKAAHAFRHAKPELIALYNEISDLLIVLRELEATLQQRSQSFSPLPPNSGLFQVIQSIKGKLEQLSEQVPAWTQSSTTTASEDTLSRIRRLGIAYQAKKYKEEFRKLRERLSAFLIVAGVSASSRIELDLRQILLLAEEAGEREEDIRSLLRDQISQTGATAQVDRTSALALAATDPAADLEPADSNPLDPEAVIDVGTTRAFHHNGKILYESRQLTAVSAVGIRTAHLPRTACKPWCSCLCHTETRIQTPQFLQCILGNLFVGYSGLPVFTKPCNEQSCQMRAQPMSYITYFFPLWFLNRMVSLTLTTTPMAGPVVSLKTQRTVPGNADIFTFAKLGNIQKLQTLFENGLASPHDVHYESGVTALHLAISHQRLDVCKYLLDMNADPFLEDRSRWTAADNAWDKILTGSFPSQYERALRLMFSETECIERRDFTTLHKIVLGLVSGDLEQQLEASTADLDVLDNNGSTAVSLAAERGDVTALRTLLRYGPDVNIGSSSGSSPLHFASATPNPSCIQPLLDAGAIVDATTDWKQTSLIYAAAYTRDARHAELLLDAGAEMDWRDLDGITALGWTAIVGNVPVAEVLIQRDAALDNVDRNGDTFLTLCVAADRTEMLRLLVGRRMSAEDLPHRSSPAKALLPVVAEHASLETIRVLCQLSITDVDFEAAREDGRTWRNILMGRADLDVDVQQTCERLLNNFLADCRNVSDGNIAASDDEQLFEDAVENQTE